MLLDLDPLKLIVFGLVAAALFAALFVLLPRRRRHWNRWRYENGSQPGRPATPAWRPHDRTDPADQLRAVMAAEYKRTRIMGQAEYRVFHIVELEVSARREGHRVFAQTSLGEVIRSEDHNAHSAINSKRVDALVIDRGGLAVIAIEYQGPRHYQRDAAARDAVKKEALRKAGVAYLEFFEHSTEDDIRRAVRETLDRLAPKLPPEAAPLPSTAFPAR